MKKRLQGVVGSDRTDKTVVVRVERTVRHPRYGKYIRLHSKLMAHDPHNEARIGDRVEIEETRPLSRHKHWRLVRIVRRASALTGESVAEEAPGSVPAQ